MQAFASSLRQQVQTAEPFCHARPFRHVVIDNFFCDEFAARLLAEFPPFEGGNARNEAGELGGKSIVERIRELGPSFAALDDLIQTPEFLGLVSRITGISDLLYDPWYFGGGTHENREGRISSKPPQASSHSGFRYTIRLSLRCQGSKISWHGFWLISLPETRRELSRRPIALYLYTRDHPVEELADSHSAVYVDRPLPERFVPGMLLQKSDLDEVRTLLARRDQHNQRLYRDLQRVQPELERAQKALYAGRLGRLRHFLSSVKRRLRIPG